MKIIYNEAKQEVILDQVSDFDITQTLTCGQCFRWHEMGRHLFRGVVFGRVIDVEQLDDHTVIFYRVDRPFFEAHLVDYFDFGTDYRVIKEDLIERDDAVKQAIAHGGGIRILNQEPFELLLSFIISGNNNIPRIAKSIEAMASAYGSLIETIDGKAYYSFPTPDQLETVTVEDYRQLGVGYRDKYLRDAVETILEGRIDLDRLLTADYKLLKETLMLIKGVGSKIADCVILFAFKNKSAFPVDTWVKKIIRTYYSEELTKNEDILKFASEHFGVHAGVAQQYLFYYARKIKL